MFVNSDIIFCEMWLFSGFIFFLNLFFDRLIWNLVYFLVIYNVWIIISLVLKIFKIKIVV